MSRIAFNPNRDQRIADESNRDNYEAAQLQCHAHGCPNRWSVSIANAPGLCSAHAWGPTSQWPAITEQQNREAFKRRAEPKQQQPQGDPVSRPDMLARAFELLVAKTSLDPLRWAKRLQFLDEQRGGVLPSGERITPAQRETYKQAMKRVTVQEPQA